MSYTVDDGAPDIFGFHIVGYVHFKFMCPRCGNTTDAAICANDLKYGFTTSCQNPACKGLHANDRPGYILEMQVRWESKFLDLQDRPLEFCICGKPLGHFEPCTPNDYAVNFFAEDINREGA